MDWRHWASIARLTIRKMSCLNGSRKLHFVQKIKQVQIMRPFGAGLHFLRIAQFFAGIGPAHFPAETTRPLGRGCLPFSPTFEIIWIRLVIPLCRYSAPAVRGIEGVRRTERVHCYRAAPSSWIHFSSSMNMVLWRN